MIQDTNENESGWTACEGSSEEAGKSINPGALSDEDDASAEPAELREVSIGLPVSIEMYREMKKAAEEKEPPSGEKGQVDPSA